MLLAQLRDEVWSRADEFYAVRGYESPEMVRDRVICCLAVLHALQAWNHCWQGAALMYRDVRAMIGELLPATPVDWYEEENLAHSAFESCLLAVPAERGADAGQPRLWTLRTTFKLASNRHLRQAASWPW